MASTFQSGEYKVMVNQLEITDTSTHSYDTDTPNASLTNSYINYAELSQSKPIIVAYSIWIYNATGETLTVQPVANVGTKKSDNKTFQFSWFNAGSSYTVPAASQGWQSFQFATNPYEYISVDLSFATAPTAGAVSGTLFAYRNRT